MRMYKFWEEVDNSWKESTRGKVDNNKIEKLIEFEMKQVSECSIGRREAKGKKGQVHMRK